VRIYLYDVHHLDHDAYTTTPRTISHQDHGSPRAQLRGVSYRSTAFTIILLRSVARHGSCATKAKRSVTLAGPSAKGQQVKSDASSSSRKGYFNFSRLVEALRLPRVEHYVLMAILSCCPNGQLSTHEFPVVVDKIAFLTRYSKARVYTALNILEREREILRRDRRRARNEYGFFRNLPTIYTIKLPGMDDAGIVATSQKRANVAPSASVAPVEPTPMFEVQEEPITEDFDDSEVDPMDPPAGYYERLQAEYLAQEESTIPTVEEPQIEIVADLSEPEPIVVDAPIAREVVPQSPEQFTEEEQIVGHEVAQYAHAKLAPLVEDAATRKRAVKGQNAITMAMFMIGRFAVTAMDTHAIGINEIFYAVDEWIEKSVLSMDPRYILAGPAQNALRLNKFFDGKGKSIDNGRRKKLGLDRC